MQHKARILERGADRRGEFVIVDKRRADAVGRRMNKEDRAAPVQFGVDRLELGLGDRAVEAGDVHVDADTAELIETALHLLEARVDMRQRQHHVGRDAIGMAMRQLGVAVIEQVDRLHAFRLVRQIGRAMRRQHLAFDPGRVHQFEAADNIGRRVGNRMLGDALLDLHTRPDPRPPAVAHEIAKGLRDIMGVDIADHVVAPPVRISAIIHHREARCQKAN
jgi:hypothetical protein